MKMDFSVIHREMREGNGGERSLQNLSIINTYIHIHRFLLSRNKKYNVYLISYFQLLFWHPMADACSMSILEDDVAVVLLVC